MRRLFLAAFGVLFVAGVASAQQPQYQPQPAPAKSAVPGVMAAAPIQPTAGATVISGTGGCSNCAPRSATYSTRGAFTMSNVTGGNCMYGYPCQNGCGSLKSTLAFQFGTCSQFFSSCGPTCGGLWKHCPTTQFSPPFGQGFQCPRAYDSYANH
ncbi:hypothetical protein [Frigoriglobus tundricola]|uniref:Uncharacterized protein n=1 Tax=Frigoriglobus tundricola TaxID=2774151 RepID=A0A6M5YXT3_9BACT|nr:hypothetical protein [Frigoriglobus tundricola]QJW98290.1 hypothetical protein FTUN_5878 [Frigoriglobus tundricola]